MRDELGLTHKVELTGWVDHHTLGRLLSESSMAILPSREESLSLAVLSAMAVGTPLIATRVGGTAEIVEHGHNGVLCPPGDVAALRDAIERLARQPDVAAELATRGRQRVREAFTWEIAAGTFEIAVSTARIEGHRLGSCRAVAMMPVGPDAPTRVLFLLATLDGGGAERTVLTLVPHLQARGLDARVGLLARRGALDGGVDPVAAGAGASCAAWMS